MKNLTTKINKILAEIGTLQKAGENAYHGYKYFSEAQLMTEMRKHFVKHKLVFTTSIVSQENKEVSRTTKSKGEHFQCLTTVSTEHTIFDTESDDTLVIRGIGQGIDEGDKAVYKAITGAVKYALMKLFMISDHQDAEADPASDSFVAKEDDIVITEDDRKKKALTEIQKLVRGKFQTKEQLLERFTPINLEKEVTSLTQLPLEILEEIADPNMINKLKEGSK